MLRPRRGEGVTKTPGFWHLVTSYAWIIASVLVAPLIILKVPGFPGAGIEQNAPQALIYGWVLQLGTRSFRICSRAPFYLSNPRNSVAVGLA